MLHINIVGVVTCSDKPLAELSRVEFDLFFSNHFIIT